MLTACAGSNAVRESRDATPSRDSDLLTAQEFANVNGSTLYDAVQQLRPAWIMRTQPNPVLQRTQGDVIVYIDGVRYGAGIAALRMFTLNSVASAQYFSPTSATARFGPGHLLGAIEVTTVPN
jgi:hypothetical protein